MPLYGYVCSKCGTKFDRIVKTLAQAECKRALPNKNVAVCPTCNHLGFRNYEGTTIVLPSTARTIALIKNPRPDPAFDGKLSVDAGRNYGHVVGTVKLTEEEKRLNNNSDVIVLNGINNGESFTPIECGCEFCTPKKRSLSDGEMMQLVIDRQLAELVSKSSTVGKDLKTDAAKQKMMDERSRGIQEHFNSGDD